MQILILLILAGGFCFLANAQLRKVKSNSPDTTRLTDSLYAEATGNNSAYELPVITLEDNDFKEISPQNISSLLSAGSDAFLSAASFNFSAVRFRVRGYDGDASLTYINGIPMNALDNGYTSFALFSGLNDVLHNRETAQGLRYNTFGFGSIGNAVSIDARAGKQRSQTNFGYAFSNRSYVHRFSFTHSTGMNKKGWAFSFSGSRRWSDEGYVAGTYYNGWSYFLGIDKKLNRRNTLSIIAFGAPAENGRQGTAVEEMMQLAGTHYYNPYWGYQAGKKRNASVARIHQPVIIFTHELRINNNTSFITALAYSTGNKSVTALDWYNAPDPRPDYYRYLPSYLIDDEQRQQLKQSMSADINKRQINWQGLYDVNRESNEAIQNANGKTGNTITGRRSRYVVEERVANTQKFIFNSVLNKRINNHLALTAGIIYQSQKNNYYKRVNDLLGGAFYVDLNQFAERDFPNNTMANQNDLNHPNRILYVNDKFGYNYTIAIVKTQGWAQIVCKYNKVDFFVAAELSQTKFQRTGNVKNGLFPGNSFGPSAINSFTSASAKAGITYKLNGRNYLYVNAAYLSRAPYFDNAYISPRTRNTEQDHLTNETIQSAEGGYVFSAPNLKLRLTGYYTKFTNGLNVLSFYHDDYKNFVNYALSNINKLHYGGEFGIETRVLKNLSFNGAASVGRYYYKGRQHADVSIDNSAVIVDNQIIYADNYRVPSTPQDAYSAGLVYRSPKNWFVSISGNYFDNMWLDFNPLRRTYKAVDGVEPKSALWHQILDQIKLPPQYTLDFFGSYSRRLNRSHRVKKPVILVLNAGLNNLLNNKNIISGGFEQLRFDFDDKNIQKFPPKLMYAYGFNYFLSVALRF